VLKNVTEKDDVEKTVVRRVIRDVRYEDAARDAKPTRPLARNISADSDNWQ
jgi:hypothetical protein